MDREEQIEELQAQETEVFDIQNAPEIKHVWTQRGIQFVCDAKTHPRHVAYGGMPMPRS